MSLLGKFIGAIKSATTPQPFSVEDIKLEHYNSCETVLTEELLKLHNVKGKFECLLYPPEQTNGIGYSLFRVLDFTEAESNFHFLSPRLSVLVHSEPALVNKTILQLVCDTLRENPTWSCAHVASFLGHINCFRHEFVKNELSAQESSLLVTPLHLAVKSGSLATVKELLVLNVRLDLTDGQGNSVFHLAADTNVDMIQFLAGKNKALMNQLNQLGESPCHVACRAGRDDVLEALMRWGADPRVSQAEMYPIHWAVRNDFIKCVEVLFRWFPKTLELKDAKYGASPLHWARSKELTTLLLERGADKYAKNRFGDTPLHVLTMKDRAPCVLAMLTNTTNPNSSGRNGNYPLHLCIQTGDVDMVRALIVFGADVDATNEKKETARHLVERTKDIDRDLILYTLHAVGARRCDPGMKGCTDGCKSGGQHDGKPPMGSVPAKDHRSELYDDLLGKAVLDRALAARANHPPTNPKPLNVLSLDGGGIRGLILIQILLEIERHVGKPIKECFDWIAGTSTGGILALAIVQGKNMNYCQGLYFHLKDEVFKGKRPYDSEPLERFMKREFGEHTRMDEIQTPKVMVSGVLGDRHPAELHFFTNYPRPLADHEETIAVLRQKHLQNPLQPVPKPKDQLVWRAARCSGAAPTYFRACGRFLDGGLIANNPCLDILTEIHEYNTIQATKKPPAEVRPIGCMVTLGTGKCPLQEVKAVDVFRPEGVFELWKTALGAQNLATLLVDQATDTEGRSVDRSRAWCGMSGIPFFRLSPPINEDIPLDAREDPRLLRMLWETRAYLHHNKERLEQLAKLLNS